MSGQISFNFNVERPGRGPASSPHYDTEGEFIESGSSADGVFDAGNVERPIHYLGSKLRLVKSILDAVNEAGPSGGAVCDLFAGSGTISKALSGSRRVISVDIQEYSRVLCTALLQPPAVGAGALADFRGRVRTSEHSRRLTWAVEPLAAYEARCLEGAARGDLEPLCDLLEHGSLLVWEHGACGATSDALRLALGEASSRLRAQQRRVGCTDRPLAACVERGGYLCRQPFDAALGRDRHAQVGEAVGGEPLFVEPPGAFGVAREGAVGGAAARVYAA